MLLLSIALGGMLGAYARFRASARIYARTGHAFPWGTLAVNLAGSFALGLLVPHLELQPAPSSLRGFATVGFLGAFTTFSTFAAEALLLLEDGRRVRAALYVVASLALGLAAVAAGLWLSPAP